MPILTPSVVLLTTACALVAGLLVGWVHFRLRTGADFVPLAGHRAELLAMRRLYRRRLRSMRDLVLRHKSGEQKLREQIAELTTAIGDRDTALAAMRARAQALDAELGEARAKIAGFERNDGLLRIEREEIVAHTQRLRALTASAQDAGAAPADAPREASPAARTQLAERDARIHELECQVRERESRLADLESSLNTWKYRIAPLALHVKRQRERAQGRHKKR